MPDGEPYIHSAIKSIACRWPPDCPRSLRAGQLRLSIPALTAVLSRRITARLAPVPRATPADAAAATSAAAATPLPLPHPLPPPPPPLSKRPAG